MAKASTSKKKAAPKKAAAKKSTTKKQATSRVSSQTKAPSPSTSILSIVVVVLVVVQLLFSFMIWTKVERLDSFFEANFEEYGSDAAGPAAAAAAGNGYNQQAAPADIEDLDLENEPVLGNADAQITIVEYSDYECPFCARFYSSTLAEIKTKYIETGVAKLVYKDFALSFHPLARPAAISATCVYNLAGDEAYYEMHDRIFENQQSLGVAQFKAWALEIGVNEANYDDCVADPEVGAEADADFAEGQSIGISGTPSFVLNGKLIVGACPISVFDQAIAKELAGETNWYVDRCQFFSQ